MKQKKYLWIKVTDDELEYPVAIADSARELAKMLGVSTNSIYSAISKSRSRGNSTQFHKIELDEEDVDDGKTG